MNRWLTSIALFLRTLVKPAALSLPVLLLGACAWAPPNDYPPNDSLTEVRVPARSNTSSDADNPILQTARSMLGVPYRFGGQSPETGFDCSGLVYYVHRVHGVTVPRTARALYRAASPVRRDQLSPGDLLFFKTDGKRVSHVGFYLGQGRFLHAPSSGKKVSIADYQNSYWRTRFAGAGRF